MRVFGRPAAMGHALLALTIWLPGSLQAQDGPVTGRIDVRAAAPDDIGPEDVGRLYTREFRRIIGGTNSVLPGDGTGVRVARRATTDRVLTTVESEYELAANARVWGLGSARASTADVTRHGYYRAYAIEEIHMMDDRLAVPAVPGGAEWYVSAVYVGRLIEVHFWSNTANIAGALSGTALVGSASIEGFARQHRLQFRIRTVGLEPAGDDALFAATPSEMRAAYRETGQPTAVLVQYSRVPRTSLPQVQGPAGSRVVLSTISFPQRKPSGTSWDAFGNAPDIMVRVSQGGTVLLDRFIGQDILEANPDLVIGEAITVSAESPLIFQFTDRDVASHDDAGQAIVTALDPPGSRMTVVGSIGVRVVLSIQESR
ncbi:MAG: hypothetical protein M5U28_38990 [Sandaracinaceae bacterium]|nr:hypothetical protein [Sandaracinaceae bacterium]